MGRLEIRKDRIIILDFGLEIKNLLIRDVGLLQRI